MSFDVTVRCSDGHLYTAKWVPLVGLRSVRLGQRNRFARCPIDRKWRMAGLVDPETLSATEVMEARQHHVGLQ